MMTDVVGLLVLPSTGCAAETDVPNGLCGFIGWLEGAANDNSRQPTQSSQSNNAKLYDDVQTAATRLVKVGAFGGAGTMCRGNVASILSWCPLLDLVSDYIAIYN
ncbi:unnamed protein product [Strongylus vulgaris]|uniref:Secreted protein n=1 Tax=Strongylus vulgaris TaxID=40348 RepID=A0A3P7KSH8_STRVU|nr:unnamed protein product [Strongylus vulgaris]